MENAVENINIEKNKELFEYEMTEVILKLKGEFAAFSGKDTKFAEILVKDESLHICTPKPAKAQMKEYDVQTPKVGNIPRVEFGFIEMRETALKLPVLPQGLDVKKEEKEGAGTIQDVRKINFPMLPKINPVSLSNSSSMSLVKKKEIKFEAPGAYGIKLEINTPTVTKKEIAVPEFTHIEVVGTRQVNLNRKSLSVPELARMNLKKLVTIENSLRQVPLKA